MIAVLSALALAGAFAKPGLANAAYGVGPWRLEVRSDSFAQTTSCALKGRKAEVRQGRLIWRLGSGVDSTNAVYRIDGGEPVVQSARALPPTANTRNPSDGMVVALLGQLTNARLLEARPNPRARLRQLSVERLDEVLLTAARLGCAPF